MIALIILTKQAYGEDSWGPYIQPYEDKALAVWYENNKCFKEEIPLSGTFEKLGKKIEYKIPTEIKRMLLVSDVHAHPEWIEKYGSDFDVLLAAGDMTHDGSIDQYAPIFNAQQGPLLWTSGNHDRWQKGESDTEAVMGRPNNFYQKVGNIGVFVMFLDDPKRVNETILAHIGDTDVDHQFMLIHYPLYSTGAFGSSFEPHVSNIEAILDSHPNHRVRAIITGHDHLFNLFVRKNVFIMVVAPSGDPEETTYQEFQPDSPRYFKGFKTGPLETVDENCKGYENHVESFVYDDMRIKTYLDIKADKLVYTVVDIVKDQVVRIYEQFL